MPIIAVDVYFYTQKSVEAIMEKISQTSADILNSQPNSNDRYN